MVEIVQGKGPLRDVVARDAAQEVQPQAEQGLSELSSKVCCAESAEASTEGDGCRFSNVSPASGGC